MHCISPIPNLDLDLDDIYIKFRAEYWFGLRIWERLGLSEYILHVEKTCILGGKKTFS